MRRRTFMTGALGLAAAAAAVTAIPALAAAGRPKVKITDVQVKRIRVIKELGATVSGRAYRVGGDLVTLIQTDAGLTGIGPGVTPAMLNVAEEPLPRWDFDQLAQLRRASNVRLAGGEASTGLHEYRGMLEKDSLDIIQFELTVVARRSLARSPRSRVLTTSRA